MYMHTLIYMYIFVYIFSFSLRARKRRDANWTQVELLLCRLHPWNAAISSAFSKRLVNLQHLLRDCRILTCLLFYNVTCYVILYLLDILICNSFDINT